MSADVRGGEGIVLPHVQRFADDVMGVGAESFGTYPGHDPDISRAVDVFVPIDSRVLGDKITSFAIANMKRYGIWYLIYRQRIYNPEIGNYWRDMEDRGSPTQNHFDHVHLSFYVSGGIVVEKPKKPKPTIKTEDNLFIYDAPKEVGGGVWFTDMYSKWGVPNEDSLLPWQKGFVQHLGTVTKAFHVALRSRTDGTPDNPGVG